LSNTQWRCGPAGILGLDYPAAFRIAELHGIPVTPQLHIRLMALEAEALKEKKSKNRGSKNSDVPEKRR